MTRSPFDDLRALGALEVELDALLAETVAAARRSGMSWDQVAAAVGMSRSGAWKRWRDVADAPGPTRHQRGRGGRPELDEHSDRAVDPLVADLVQRLRTGDTRDPWAAALRAVLLHRRMPSTAQRTPDGARFFMRNGGVVASCVEPSAQAGSGGIVVTVLPAGSPSGGTEARTLRTTWDGDELPTSAELFKQVDEFVGEWGA